VTVAGGKVGEVEPPAGRPRRERHVAERRARGEVVDAAAGHAQAAVQARAGQRAAHAQVGPEEPGHPLPVERGQGRDSGEVDRAGDPAGDRRVARDREGGRLQAELGGERDLGRERPLAGQARHRQAGLDAAPGGGTVEVEGDGRRTVAGAAGPEPAHAEVEREPRGRGRSGQGQPTLRVPLQRGRPKPSSIPSGRAARRTSPRAWPLP
jgi:hypothetical protein